LLVVDVADVDVDDDEGDCAADAGRLALLVAASLVTIAACSGMSCNVSCMTAAIDPRLVVALALTLAAAAACCCARA